jgi:hypothetical protein
MEELDPWRRLDLVMRDSSHNIPTDALAGFV